MRRWLKTLPLAGVFAVLLCTSALAADSTEGIHILTMETGLTLTAQTAAGADVTEAAEADNGTLVYAGTERVAMTYTGVTSGECMVFVLDDDTGIPSVDNIVYINQAAADASGVSFNLYPESLTSGKTYSIYISGAEKPLTEVGSFGYYVSYLLGDPSGDKKINMSDAQMALRHYLRKTKLTGNQFLAADVNQDGEVKMDDASMILRYYVKRLTSFS